jgi:hypothetical protein
MVSSRMVVGAHVIVWTYGIRVFFRRVKNQVFLSIFDSKDRNTAKVRHAFFKIDSICASKA